MRMAQHALLRVLTLIAAIKNNEHYGYVGTVMGVHRSDETTRIMVRALVEYIGF